MDVLKVATYVELYIRGLADRHTNARRLRGPGYCEIISLWWELLRGKLLW